jgi:hypothetical protein
MLDPKIATDHVNIFQRQKPIRGCQKLLYNQLVIEADRLRFPAMVYVQHFPVFLGAVAPRAARLWRPAAAVLRFAR